MTREEAMNVLKKYTDTDSGISRVVAEAHSMAIEALMQEPCDDCISREAAINCVTAASMCDPIITQRRIKLLPSVNPKPKTGRWIDARTGRFFKDNVFRCSECDDYLDFNGLNGGRGHANFCPNCGAKMEVEHD